MDPARTRHVLPDTLIDRLARCTEILNRDPLTSFVGDRFEALAPQVDILLTGWGAPRITERELEAMPALRLVAHAAGTVKAMLPEALFARGVLVTSAAEANARPVAEFTLALIILAGKRVFPFREAYRQTRDRSLTAPMLEWPIGNRARTVGIVGASRIGRRVIELLRPFDGFEVVLTDPTLDAAAAAALGVRLVGLDDLIAASDIVSLHAPSVPATRHMIGARHLAAMRDGATLINTARGALVDESALIAELQRGRIFAMIDVTEPEVPQSASPLYDLPNVFLTPHIAGAVGLERTRLGEMAVAEVERFVAGEPLHYAITAEELETIA